MTKISKIRLGNCIYVFEIPKTCSEEITEVIKNAKVLMIKDGMQISVNCNGVVLGNKAKKWNLVKIREEIFTKEIGNLIKDAIQRTKLSESEEPVKVERRLTPLFSPLHGKQQIKNNGEYYFIDSVVYCANCHNSIKGLQKLDINPHGKVAKTHSFIPTEPTVKLSSGKKWVHVQCAVATIEIPEDLKIAKISPPIPEKTITLKLNKVLYDGVMEALENPDKIHLISGLAWALFKLSE
jgi:hypothetical protein